MLLSCRAFMALFIHFENIQRHKLWLANLKNNPFYSPFNSNFAYS
jgi:hypothetical protein